MKMMTQNKTEEEEAELPEGYGHAHEYLLAFSLEECDQYFHKEQKQSQKRDQS